jgi:hypothetical protein
MHLHNEHFVDTPRTFVWYCPECELWQLDCDWRLLDTAWASEDIQNVLADHVLECKSPAFGWSFISVDGLRAS